MPVRVAPANVAEAALTFDTKHRVSEACDRSARSSTVSSRKATAHVAPRATAPVMSALEKTSCDPWVPERSASMSRAPSNVAPSSVAPRKTARSAHALWRVARVRSALREIGLPHVGVEQHGLLEERRA